MKPPDKTTPNGILSDKFDFKKMLRQELLQKSGCALTLSLSPFLFVGVVTLAGGVGEEGGNVGGEGSAPPPTNEPPSARPPSELA